MDVDVERVLEPRIDGPFVGREVLVPLADVDAVAARIRERMSNTIENIIAIGDDLIMIVRRGTKLINVELPVEKKQNAGANP